MKLCRPATFESLRKIRHAGNRSTPNLILETKIATELSVICNLVDFRREFSRLLPGNEILKPFNSLSHKPSCWVSQRWTFTSITHHSLLITHHSVSKIRYRFLQPLSQRNRRSPTKQFLSASNVWLALLRIVLRQRKILHARV